MNAKERGSAWTKLLYFISGSCLLANGSCLPDNFFADLAGGLITVGAELVISDVVGDALAGSGTE